MMPETIDLAKNILRKERSKRTRPNSDDKIITAWNALMLKGYNDACSVFNEPYEVAIVGRDDIEKRIELDSFYLLSAYSQLNKCHPSI